MGKNNPKDANQSKEQLTDKPVSDVSEDLKSGDPSGSEVTLPVEEKQTEGSLGQEQDVEKAVQEKDFVSESNKLQPAGSESTEGQEIRKNSTIKQESATNDTTTNLTEGMQVMNVAFDPGNRKDAHEIKMWCANMYDWFKREVAHNPLPFMGPINRLMSIALTHLETFQMNAVKAVTFFPDFSDLTPPESYDSPTDGQMACTVSFNAGGRWDVSFIKTQCAEIFDRMNDLTDFMQRHITPSGESEKRTDAEYTTDKRKFSFAAGAKDVALYNLCQFQMYAVKAITRRKVGKDPAEVSEEVAATE